MRAEASETAVKRVDARRGTPEQRGNTPEDRRKDVRGVGLAHSTEETGELHPARTRRREGASRATDLLEG